MYVSLLCTVFVCVCMRVCVCVCVCVHACVCVHVCVCACVCGCGCGSSSVCMVWYMMCMVPYIYLSFCHILLITHMSSCTKCTYTHLTHCHTHTHGCTLPLPHTQPPPSLYTGNVLQLGTLHMKVSHSLHSLSIQNHVATVLWYVTRRLNTHSTHARTHTAHMHAHMHMVTYMYVNACV